MKTKLTKFTREILDTKVVFVLIGFFVSAVLGVWFGYLEPSLGLSLVTSVGVLVAVMKFLYEKQKDKKNEIIELVSFFRGVVISSHSNFANIVRDETKNQNLKFPKIHLKELSISFVRNNHSVLANKQIEYIYHSHKTADVATDVLNAMEEFSFKVILLDALTSKELVVVHSTFVMIVEDLAMMILSQRELGAGDTMFTNTLSLYQTWKDGVDRVPYEEKLQKLRKELGLKNK